MSRVTTMSSMTEGGGIALNTTMASPLSGPQWVPLDTFIGLVLAFSSCFFIGISVIYKKLALRDIQMEGGTRAVDGGYGYLRRPKWWIGITLMALGELTNFVAYIFAPAILVTPLGVFSIVCTAALSPYFLKERLAMLGKLGCVLVLVGCVIVTLSGPKDREITSMEELQAQLLHPGFLVYAGLVVGISGLFMALVPRYGHRYVLLYITICSSFGSLSVMFCKGVGLALKQTIIGINEFTNWATWVCLVALVTCLLIETVYMQRALDIFNSSVFMSINYVLFTSLVIVASSILYTELREIGWKNIVLTLLGFVVNIVALYLLHLDKDDGTNPTLSTENRETSQDSTPSLKVTAGGIDQGTPLLSRAPASPLASINITHNMFPAKTNSCMSLISQNSVSHHVKDNNNQKTHHDHNDSPSQKSSSSCGSSDSNIRSSSSSSSSSSSNSERQNIDTACEGGLGHCRSASGCMCEVPLLTELHTSNSKFSVPPHSPQGSSSDKNQKNIINNNTKSSRRSSSSSSKSGEAGIDIEDVEESVHHQSQVYV